MSLYSLRDVQTAVDFHRANSELSIDEVCGRVAIDAYMGICEKFNLSKSSNIVTLVSDFLQDPSNFDSFTTIDAKAMRTVLFVEKYLGV